MANAADSRIVIAVSQNVMTKNQDGPALDFHRLADELGAVLVGYDSYPRNAPLIRRVENTLALDIFQAIHILRKYPHAACYVTFSGMVGMPLGALIKRKINRPRHIMIGHRLNTPRKKALTKLTAWPRGVDKIVTLCTGQSNYARRLSAGSVAMVRQGADTAFYSPGNETEDGYVLAAGSENRDYETLVNAAKISGIRVNILSNSPWCRRVGADISGVPDNVRFLPYATFPELIKLYRKASIVAVPLFDADYAAGLNGVLEALAVNKPLVVSRSQGIIDYVKHGENALLVEPGDAESFAGALMKITNDDDLKAKMILGTRESVENYANLESYIQSLKTEIGQDG